MPRHRPHRSANSLRVLQKDGSFGGGAKEGFARSLVSVSIVRLPVVYKYNTNIYKKGGWLNNKMAGLPKQVGAAYRPLRAA